MDEKQRKFVPLLSAPTTCLVARSHCLFSNPTCRTKQLADFVSRSPKPDTLWIMDWMLAGVGGLACLFWMILHGLGALALMRVPRLIFPAKPRPVLPSLSVVVAACNESESLEPALLSLLQQDYPDLQVVLVDDRSSDDTALIVDRLAHSDSRIRAVHITELPPDTLGKVNALRCGMQQSSGEYVLFSDADVHFRPGILQAAMELVLGKDLDHLTLLPRLKSTSALHAALMQAFFVGYIRRTKAKSDLISDQTPFGYGAFNLVKRSAFERTEGFEWFRMEVLDDLALGALMKQSGARSAFAVAVDALEILWYPAWVAAVRGFAKNAIGGLAGYRFTSLIGLAAGMLWLGIGPALVFLQSSFRFLWLLPLLSLVALFVESFVARKRFQLELLPGMMAPLTHLLMTYAVLRSGWICFRNKGIFWRGTFYPLKALRAGRRVSFP